MLVSAKDASSGDATEQTQQLSLQGGVQLVDRCGQLVADERGGQLRSELAEIICGITEPAMQQGHDLLVGGGALRGQVTSATGAPGRVAEDLFLGRVDGIVERHANASTTGTGIQGSVALNDATLDPLRLLEDAFAGVLEELGTSHQVRQKTSAGIVFGYSSHFFGLKEGLRGVLQGLTASLCFKQTSPIWILRKKNHLLGDVKTVFQPRVGLTWESGTTGTTRNTHTGSICGRKMMLVATAGF